MQILQVYYSKSSARLDRVRQQHRRRPTMTRLIIISGALQAQCLGHVCFAAYPRLKHHFEDWAESHFREPLVFCRLHCQSYLPFGV